MTPNLETTWLGLPLSHPVVALAGPLTHELDNFRRLGDAGVAAIVMHSLFEEQITRDSHLVHHYQEYGTDSFGEALSYVPELEDYGTGSDTYLSLISAAKEAVSVPIIASLNGTTPGGWRKFAHEMERAGADALELNLYHLPTDPDVPGSQVEALYLGVVREVVEGLKIPLAVKLSPFLTAPAHMAGEFASAGAKGLVLFNRFYQPDIDLDELQAVPRLVLSTHTEMRLPLRWGRDPSRSRRCRSRDHERRAYRRRRPQRRPLWRQYHHDDLRVVATRPRSRPPYLGCRDRMDGGEGIPIREANARLVESSAYGVAGSV